MNRDVFPAVMSLEKFAGATFLFRCMSWERLSFVWFVECDGSVLFLVADLIVLANFHVDHIAKSVFVRVIAAPFVSRRGFLKGERGNRASRTVTVL